MIKNILLRWLIGLTAVLAMIIIVMLTPVGLRISLYIVNAVVPGKISYDHVAGVITGPINIKNFNYTDGKTTISIHQLKFSWEPWQLLHRIIEVSHFTANHIHVTLHFQKSKAVQIPEKAKPYLLNIRNAHINHLSIGNVPHQYPIVIRYIRFNARVTSEHVMIRAQAQLTKPFPLSADLNVSGTLNHYRVDAQTMSEQLSWHLYGVGNANGIALNLKGGKTLGGTLSFNTNVTWVPQLTWNLGLNGTHLNFKTLNLDWPDQMTVTLSTHGNVKDNKPTFFIKTLIASPGNHINLQAQQTHQLKLKWNLNISNLSSLYKKFKGSIQSKGEWTTQSKIPITTGQLQARNIAAFGYSANTLTGKWRLSANQQPVSNFNISGINIKSPNLQFNNLTLQGNGNIQRHHLKGDINFQGNHCIFQLRGGLFNTTWKGTLQEFVLTSKRYQHWQLTKPTSIVVSQTHATTHNLCFNTSAIKGKLCVSGHWNSQGPWQFIAKGQQFNLGILAQFLPKLTLKIPSTLRATISGQRNVFQSANINVAWQKGAFHYQLNGNDVASPVQSGNINIDYTKHKVSASAQLHLVKHNKLGLSLSLPNFSIKTLKNKQRINGTLTAYFDDFTPFNKLLQAIAKPKGTLSLDLSIGGRLSAPDVRGRIALNDASVYIPQLGIELTKMNTNITSFSQTRLHYDITAYSKNQPIHIMGNATRTPQGIKNITNIVGNHVLIMDTPQYTIYASPTLKIAMVGYNINLTGAVNIPQGIIQPGEFANVTTIPSDQIIYTAGNPFINHSTWQISANLDVSLGNDVKVNTSGFDAMVTGKARIIGKPKTTTLANGHISIVKGMYSAYGKTLTITPGSFIEFINSPINNPHFNIRATKLIRVTQSVNRTQTNIGSNDIIVGVGLQGTFRHPKITFFSIPANLSQADILSYLVLGYASNTTSGSNLGILLEAANTLGGKGNGIGGVISEIKQGLGLSELGLESETLVNVLGTSVNQQTAFVIGKRLTKNIYIRYSLGLGQGPFAPVNIFQLRYTLNNHWAIQTDSSALGNGGDVLYTIQTK